MRKTARFVPRFLGRSLILIKAPVAWREPLRPYSLALTKRPGRAPCRISRFVPPSSGEGSAAYRLRMRWIRRGIDVTVYEQAPALGEVGAGVFTYPNALCPLERMGLGDAFAK